MVKKIIDVFPPKRARVASKILKRDRKIVPNLGRKVLLLFLLLIIVMVGSLQLFFSKVEIVLHPVTEISRFRETITVDSALNEANFEQKIIPGKIFETQKFVSDEFSTQGRVLKKSEGVIRLYNAFTTRPETWLKGTRFVSSEGKLFLSKERIHIPGARLKGGKIVPSFVDVPVIASKGGEEYNIGPSNFSVVAFLGTPRYTSFYGESTTSMSGGGEFPVVKEEDLQRAERELTDRAKAEAESEFKKIIPKGFVFLAPSMKTEVLEKTSSAQVGAELDTFKFNLATKSKVLAFNSKDIEEFADFIIRSQIASGKKIWLPSLETKYQPEDVNLSEGKMIISLEGSAKVYPEIDFESLKKVLRGKSLQEASILLANKEEISDSKIKVFPFWLGKIPQKIDVKIVID